MADDICWFEITVDYGTEITVLEMYYYFKWKKDEKDINWVQMFLLHTPLFVTIGLYEGIAILMDQGQILKIAKPPI